MTTQYQAIFTMLEAHIACEMERKGRLRIVPVREFPPEVPPISVRAQVAYFAVASTSAGIAEFNCRCNAAVNRIVDQVNAGAER